SVVATVQERAARGSCSVGTSGEFASVAGGKTDACVPPPGGRGCRNGWGDGPRRNSTAAATSGTATSSAHHQREGRDGKSTLRRWLIVCWCMSAICPLNRSATSSAV